MSFTNMLPRRSESFTKETEAPGKILFVRHGQSKFNEENRFAGWVDTKLTQAGIDQAQESGNLIKTNVGMPDFVFVTPLERARQTAEEALVAMGIARENLVTVITESSKRLMDEWKIKLPDNVKIVSEVSQQAFAEAGVTPQQKVLVMAPEMLERHYGDMTGYDKAKALEELKEDGFTALRRDYHQTPPAMDSSNPHHPDNAVPELKIIGIPPTGQFTESLEDVHIHRVKPFLENTLIPLMEKGKTVAIFAHGNSGRALDMELTEKTPDEIKKFEIKNGEILEYEVRVNKEAEKGYTVKAKGPISAQGRSIP